mgnify:CR=1 FL=1
MRYRLLLIDHDDTAVDFREDLLLAALSKQVPHLYFLAVLDHQLVVLGNGMRVAEYVAGYYQDLADLAILLNVHGTSNAGDDRLPFFYSVACLLESVLSLHQP